MSSKIIEEWKQLDLTTLTQIELLEKATEMQEYVRKSNDGSDKSLNTALNIIARLEQLERRTFNNKTAIKQLEEDNEELTKRIEELEDYADETEANFTNLEKKVEDSGKIDCPVNEENPNSAPALSEVIQKSESDKGDESANDML